MKVRTGWWWGTLLAAGLAAACGGGGSADFDGDDDGLIEISNLEQLDALRWDLDGDGTADDAAGDGPYRAAFPDAADGMGCPGACSGYELSRDLDFNDPASYAAGAVNPEWVGGSGWSPIGDHPAPYAGVLEGSGQTVSNLFIDRGDRNYVGLLGENTGAVGNLNLSVNITGGTAVGGLTGRNSGQIRSVSVEGAVSGTRDVGGLAGTNWGTVEDAAVSGKVAGTIVVGGLTGINYRTITGSSVSGSVKGASRVIAGLAGINWGDISDSFSGASVEGADIVGGLAAMNQGQGTIVDSYSHGMVTGRYQDVGGLVGVNYSRISGAYSSSLVMAVNRAGGLVGSNRTGAVVERSYATGTVAGEISSGGLVGWNDGTINESFASGDVGGFENDLGGLAGRNDGTIRTSYAVGGVTGYHRVGGLVGYSNPAGYIIDSYASGPVTGTSAAGGLVGWNLGDIVNAYSVGPVTVAAGTGRDRAEEETGGLVGVNDGVVNGGVWDTATSGQSQGTGAFGLADGMTGAATAELRQPAGASGLYQGWSGDVWDFGGDGDYPRLKADWDGDGQATAAEFTG